MYVQYEHASGYVLVHCDQTDDINQMDVSDWGEFGQICKLTAFKPFTSAANALDNMNAISEGLFTILWKIQRFWPNWTGPHPEF